ncbi:MAG TPA: LamG-like jellyroll fold domain-containing protein, partial [Kineosporiaceae bacterium]|nr:LamG-like jellyroll fold domain-containing protein [Kineosporiaceae bacterium]
MDTSVQAGTEYSYTVTAVDGAGHESARSEAASAIPDPATTLALDFDGVDDHVTLGAATNLNSNTFTVETWFRQDGAGVLAQTTTGTGGISAYPLVTKGRSGGGTINWFLGITATGQLAADYEDAASDGNHGIVGTTTIVNGTWHHAAATYDGATFRLYLDGNLEASVASTDGPGTSSAHHAAFATAMDTAGVPGGYFNGVLDEVRIWNLARSQAQILSSRDLELTSGTGLLGRWGMNEGVGTAVGNSVASGPNGAAVNGPLWVSGSPFFVPDTAPAAPTGLGASAGNNSVALSWDANAEPDLAGYRVYRATSLPVSTAGTPLSGTTLLTAPSYLDSTAINGTTYYYVVTAVDDAANASLASASASATPSAAAGTGLDFDGTNDHVTLGGQSAFNSNTFTIETWFRRDGTGVATGTSATTPGLVSVIPLVTKGRTGGTAQIVNWFLGIDTATNRIAADFETAADDVNHGLMGTTTLVTGTWYHAAATYDGTTFRVYLNGVQENSVAVANGPGTGSTHPAALGTALDTTGATGGFFDGVLDEVRIWNVARSASQISTAMTQELTSGSGLTARYGMNEGIGTAVGNSIAGGPAGTAVGGPAWVPGAPFALPPVNDPPATPVLVGPADGVIGVATDPELSVQVSDPEGGTLTTTFYGRETAPATAPDFSIIALPDTQYYSNSSTYIALFNAQTQWIVDNQATRDIAFVTHLGDITDTGDSSETPWQRATGAMATLDNTGVPNSVVAGNHDVNGTTGNGTFFDQYFPPSRYQGFSWYGGYLGQDPGDPVNRLNKDNYELFSVGGLGFIVIHLELDTPDYALDWAEALLDQYSDRKAIIVTHIFINTSGQRDSSPFVRPDGISAEAAWQRLRTHCNLTLVLNGHWPGEARRTDTNACGNPVPQLLADYQDRSNGGDGWLRILNFKPSENRIDVQTYSPTRNGGAGDTET